MKALYRSSLSRFFICCMAGLMALGLIPLKAAPETPIEPNLRILGPLQTFIAEAQGKLVRLDRTRFETYAADNLDSKPFLLVYYSASWCPPCKAFTPELMSFYTKMKGDYPDLFELLLFSFDRKEIDMLNYMKAFKMPWPAIAYKERSNIKYLEGYESPAIPALILIDQNGVIAVDKFEYKGDKVRSLDNQALFDKIEALLKQYKQSQSAS